MLLNILWVILVAFTLFQLLRLALTISVLSAIRLTEERSKVIPFSELSSVLRARVQKESRELRDPGFTLECVIATNEMDARDGKGSHLAFFFHAETATYAIVHFLTVSAGPRSAVIYFANYSPGEGATSYQTLPFKLEGTDSIRSRPDLVVYHISKSLEIGETYLGHGAWMGAEGIKAEARLNPDELARRHELENRAILSDLIDSRRAFPAGDGVYRYCCGALLSKAIRNLTAQKTHLKYLNQPLHQTEDRESAQQEFAATEVGRDIAGFNEGEAHAGSSRANLTEAELLDAEVETFRSHRSARQAGKGSGGWKAFWFALSVAAFIVIGGYHWSFQVAAVLTVVVLFHELGHVVAMKLVGYRDLRILFIPMAGAVALGRDERSVAPWKQLVVLFAGPMPGLLIAFGMMGWQVASGYESELFSQLITFLLILNLFNLLPVYPLDGGQIFSVTFLGRFPFLKMFFVMSSVLLLGLVWLFTQSVVFGVLAIILAISLVSEYRMAQAVTRVRARLPRDFNRSDELMLLREIFREFQEPPLSKQKGGDRMGIVQKLLNDLRQKPAGFFTMLGAAAAYLLPLWAPLLILFPTARLAEREYVVTREAMIAEGWPADLNALVLEVAEADNALPHLESAQALIETDEETAALVREVRQIVDGFHYQNYTLTDRQRNVLRERMETPEMRAVLNQLTLAASKPFLESSEWYEEANLVSRRMELSIDPPTGVMLLAAKTLTADADECWHNYTSVLRLANLFAHHALPNIRSQSYMSARVATSLGGDLFRDGNPPTEAEAVAIIEHLRRLAHGSNVDHERRLNANFVLSNMTYDPWKDMTAEEGAIYRKPSGADILSRIGTAVGHLNLSAFGKNEDLKRLKAMRSEPVPLPLPLHDYSGGNWSWILRIGSPVPMEYPLSWQGLIDYEVAPFLVLFQAADFIYRFKQEAGEYPSDAHSLWEAMADATPVDPFTGQSLTYNRDGDGFQLFSPGMAFDYLAEVEDDIDGYDPALSYIYWKGPDAVFPRWDE